MINKTALISGATHGIGKAIALELGKLGCNIVFFSSNSERVKNMKKILDEQKIKNFGVVADVFDDFYLEKIFNEINKFCSGIDILINNVGGGGRWGLDDVFQTPDSVWEEVFYKNFTVSMQLTKKVIPHMLNKEWGRVISITSIYGKQIGGRPWFNVAKVSQTVLMSNLATKKEYATKGITFNSVAPGPIMIPDTGWEKMLAEQPEKYNQYIKDLPMQRLGTPEEVAKVVAFLCSKDASFINGASIPVDGGECVCL
jgi:3-oxoacyl-[acyl-carrier protein] reductase